MATMSNEEVFRFIELYQTENCVWNPRNKYHKNKNIVSKQLLFSVGGL